MNVADELLDVVDAGDRVIGVASRGEIHARGLKHRSAHILVFNARGEVFLQKRSVHKDEQPGLWDSSAAGHVDSGEDYAACARRELDEELGIDDGAPLEVLFKLPASAALGNEHCQVFRVVHDGELRLDPGEIDGGEWLLPAALDARVGADDPTLTGALKTIWARYRGLSPRRRAQHSGDSG